MTEGTDMADDDGDDRTFAVVINDEEQYSIWPETRDLPLGWTRTSMSGSRSECLSHIDKIWVDIRPLSVRAAINRDR